MKLDYKEASQEATRYQEASNISRCYLEMEKRGKNIQKLVNTQAEDEGLWFEAKTAPEAYLQSQLRELHRVIELTKQEGE